MYSNKSKAELYELAKNKKIPNRSKMNKEQLIAALTNVPKSKSLVHKEPSMFMFEFDFDVDMFEENRKNVKVTRSEELQAGFEWYKSFAKEQADMEEAELVSFQLIKPNTIRVTLSNVKDKHMVMQGIIQPDDDGNHPLKLKGNMYTVTDVSEPRVLKN